MAWYRTGNVAVAASDTVVTGTGTLFATHVRVGDGFVGPDGRMYEVTNIASETVLSIFPPYQGATATGQDYSIIPVQGYPKQLSDRAGVLVGQVGQLPGRIDDIDDVLAALGSAAGANMPAGVTEFGTAAGAQLTELLTKAGNLAGLADKAGSQLNLGVIQTLAGEVFNSDNCTVFTSSAGVAIRSPNGIQECYGNINFSGATWQPLSALIPFPQLFKPGTAPNVVAVARGDSSGYYPVAHLNNIIDETGFRFRAPSTLTTSGTSLQCMWRAIGVWK